MHRHREVLRFIAGTVSLAAVSALVALAVWALAYPAVRGWSPVAVISGSMAPAIDAGDVVVASPLGGSAPSLGSVIVFDDPAGVGTVTHRVVAATPTGDLVTRGDGNGIADSTVVRPDQVRGIGQLIVPLVGRPHAWAANGQWIHVAAATVMLTIALWASRWALLDEFDPWPGSPGGTAR